MTKYENQLPTSAGMNFKSLISILRDSMRGNVERRPSGTMPMEICEPAETFSASDNPQVTWFGHSAFLLEIEGHRLLFDPMLGNRPSPCLGWAPNGTVPVYRFNQRIFRLWMQSLYRMTIMIIWIMTPSAD